MPELASTAAATRWAPLVDAGRTVACSTPSVRATWSWLSFVHVPQHGPTSRNIGGRASSPSAGEREHGDGMDGVRRVGLALADQARSWPSDGAPSAPVRSALLMVGTFDEAWAALFVGAPGAPRAGAPGASFAAGGGPGPGPWSLPALGPPNGRRPVGLEGGPNGPREFRSRRSASAIAHAFGKVNTAPPRRSFQSGHHSSSCPGCHRVEVSAEHSSCCRVDPGHGVDHVDAAQRCFGDLPQGRPGTPAAPGRPAWSRCGSRAR